MIESYGALTDRDIDGMRDLIEAHLDSLEREQKSKRTIGARRAVLRQAHRELPSGLDDVCQDDIETWLANPSWSRWTPHTYFSHLRGFYRWAYKKGEMTLDPTVDMKAPPSGLMRPNPLTEVELRKALQRSCEPWYSCIMLGVGAGLRASELAAIRREDITAEEVHVRNGKGGKERYVTTSDTLWSWARDKPSGLLVRRRDGAGVTGQYLSCQQWEYWPSIGLNNMYLHRLRHTFCTTMWQARADPLVIRDEMGHTSIATTQAYAVPARVERRNAIAAIDCLLREHQPGLSRLVSADPHPEGH